MIKMTQKKKGTAEPVDKHVGSRLRIRRSLLGLSQEKLADKVGITFQQVQKYERGTNRISSSRLYQFSKILGVPVEYFFGEMDKNLDKATNLAYGMADNAQEGFAAEENDDEDIMQRKETLKLVRAYYSIPDPKAREHILKLMKTMGRSDDE
ncbi:MAG: helix-turn-helix domain-containing protein [Alphaproteobacteria bacterium]